MVTSFLFLCKNESLPEGNPLLNYCKETLNTLLQQGMTVQSASVGDEVDERYEYTGIIPEKIVFSFIVKHEHKEK